MHVLSVEVPHDLWINGAMYKFLPLPIMITGCANAPCLPPAQYMLLVRTGPYEYRSHSPDMSIHPVWEKGFRYLILFVETESNHSTNVVRR